MYVRIANAKFNTITIKCQKGFYNILQIISEIYSKCKGTRIADMILKENKMTFCGRELIFPNVKIYYRAIVTKTKWYWLSYRHIGE